MTREKIDVVFWWSILFTCYIQREKLKWLRLYIDNAACKWAWLLRSAQSTLSEEPRRNAPWGYCCYTYCCVLIHAETNQFTCTAEWPCISFSTSVEINMFLVAGNSMQAPVEQQQRHKERIGRCVIHLQLSVLPALALLRAQHRRNNDCWWRGISGVVL